MGLDGVELVMDVEDHWGITITDEETTRIRTVGDVIALIRFRVVAAKAEGCPTLAMFLSLRKWMRQAVADKTLRIRPHDRLTTLLTPQQRRRLWEHLSETLGTALPSLRRPPRMRKLLAAVALIIAASALTPMAVDGRIVLFTLVLALLINLGVNVATASFRIEPPAGWTTVGDVVRQLVSAHAATKNTDRDDDAAILNQLQPIIAKALGVRPDAVVPSARLVEDLGLS